MAQSIDKISVGLQRIDKIICESPTAQALANQAPAILQHFKELNANAQLHRQRMEMMFVERSYDLEKFRDKAPIMIEEIRHVSNEIRLLQKHVREMAAKFIDDPNARTVIDYTNAQIVQQINLFNNLIINFLNA